MGSRRVLMPLMFILLVLASSFCSSSGALLEQGTSFAAALEALQKQIGYKFKTVGLLRRAMTHASYSLDNNKALSILGLESVQSSISLLTLQADPDASAEQVTLAVSGSTDSDACAADGLRLGVDRIVRVAAKTNASSPSVVCGAFRAIFGAVALDSGKLDSVSDVFGRNHVLSGGEGRFAVSDA